MRIELKRLNKEYLLLFLIATLVLITRLATYKFEYLLVYDTFHHYKIAEYIAEKGEFPFIWYLSRYPEGARISEPMGLYYVSVFFYKILKPFGLSFMQTFKLVTPFFGAIIIVPVYLLTRYIFNKRAAFIAILLLAFIPAFMYRTFSGFYRGDPFSIFFMIFGFYFFLSALDKDIKKNIAFSTLAGVSFGFMGFVWNGFLFGFVIVSAFVILYSLLTYIQAKESKLVFLSYLISVGIGILIINYSISLQPHAQTYIKDLIKYIYPMTLLSSGALEVLKLKAKGWKVEARIYSLLILAVILYLFIWHFIPDFFYKLFIGYGLVKAASPLLKTIGELQAPSLDTIWRKYYIVFSLSLLGLIYLIKDFYVKKSKQELLMLIWFASSLYVLKAAIRYAFIASIPIAIVSAIFLENLFKTDILRGRSQIKTLPKIFSVALLLTIGFHGITYASTVNPHLTDNWYEALSFLKSQDEGTVLSWWDYGSWIQGITGFPTLLDTVHGQDVGRMKEVGWFFYETNESKTIDLLRKYHVDYVVVPVEMIGQVQNVNAILGISNYHYQLYPYSRTEKINGIDTRVYGANAFYIQDTLRGKAATYAEGGNSFFIKNVYYKEGRNLISIKHSEENLPILEGGIYIIDDFVVYMSPKIHDTLLNSLMLLDGKGFDSYKLLYANPQVRIYKPVYDYTRTDVLKTEKLYYKAGENVNVYLEVKSTNPFRGQLQLTIFNPENKVIFSNNYNVTERTIQNIFFTLPKNSPSGEYIVKGELYIGKDILDSIERRFRV